MQMKTENSAGGIVFKKVPEGILWLITQHSQHKHWGFPKGLIGDTIKDEDKTSAALREVNEEGGITALIVDTVPVEVKYKYRFEDTLVDKTVSYFLMEYKSGDPKNHDWEVSDAKFATQEEVMNTVTFKTEKEAFEKALKKYSHLYKDH